MFNEAVTIPYLGAYEDSTAFQERRVADATVGVKVLKMIHTWLSNLQFKSRLNNSTNKNRTHIKSCSDYASARWDGRNHFFIMFSLILNLQLLIKGDMQQYFHS